MNFNSSIVFIVLVVSLRFTVTLGCLARRQEPAGYRQRRPIMDLVDEKDDGQTLTLGDSEKMIVPPEEDEDPTDDQAADIDKKEDLEDLGSVQVVHLDNEVYELDIPSELLPQFKIFNQSADQSSVVLISTPHRKHGSPHSRKTNHTSHDKPNAPKTRRTTTKRPREEFPPGKGQLKSGVTRQSISKDGKGVERESANQAIIVVVVVLAFLLCLMIVICVVLLIKIRLINKTCKVSRTSLLDKEMPLMV